ncbi:MAG: nucleoside-diphosphate kinase (ndk) [Cenarchaeum symbiont of Oopsacas minuta]|nr:nucleoside-diphosphate kinase (ndk) [Cenarchaeum symbiont of Oopsacas minuta]
MMEHSLFMVKPDGVTRGLVGNIVNRFEQKGFIIQEMKMLRFTQKQAEEFYKVHAERPFFKELIQFITSGSVVVAVVQGRNAISAARTMLGSTDSSKAEAGSIRGDYGLGFTDNIIHASDSTASFEHEQRVVFQ